MASSSSAVTPMEVDVDAAAAASSSTAARDTSGLPWVEKYRPSRLDELASQQDIVNTLERFMSKGKLPHLLFYGPPGTGKTTTIQACARRLFGDRMRNFVLELNASDDRGINVVREQIKDFASTKKIFSSGFKLVVLDEADQMTNDAQAALRRVIEQYTKNARFCLICNNVNKIIPALQSRCMRFRFSPLKVEDMIPKVRQVATEEGVEITEDAIQALVRLSGGDMRRVMNVLQSTAMAFKQVDEDAIYSCTGLPRPHEISDVVRWLCGSPFSECFKNIRQMQQLRGHSLADLLRGVYELTRKLSLSQESLAYLVECMADIEYRLSSGCSEKVQLSSLVGAFIMVREAESEENMSLADVIPDILS